MDRASQRQEDGHNEQASSFFTVGFREQLPPPADQLAQLALVHTQKPLVG